MSASGSSWTASTRPAPLGRGGSVLGGPAGVRPRPGPTRRWARPPPAVVVATARGFSNAYQGAVEDVTTADSRQGGADNPVGPVRRRVLRDWPGRRGVLGPLDCLVRRATAIRGGDAGRQDDLECAGQVPGRGAVRMRRELLPAISAACILSPKMHICAASEQMLRPLPTGRNAVTADLLRSPANLPGHFTQPPLRHIDPPRRRIWIGTSRSTRTHRNQASPRGDPTPRPSPVPARFSGPGGRHRQRAGPRGPDPGRLRHHEHRRLQQRQLGIVPPPDRQPEEDRVQPAGYQRVDLVPP